MTNPDAPRENTDRELWRGPDDGRGSYYADRIWVTKDGAIGMDVGGNCIVAPIREWHRALSQAGGESTSDALKMDRDLEHAFMAGHSCGKSEGRREAYEACAKIADERKYKGSGATTVRVCNDIAAAIRSQGETDR